VDGRASTQTWGSDARTNPHDVYGRLGARTGLRRRLHGHARALWRCSVPGD